MRTCGSIRRLQSDTALALAMAQVMIAEKLCKDDYIKEQTDLPFLVRTDTGRFLRERDVTGGGRDDAFYLWDEGQEAAVLAPGSRGMRRPTLVFGEIRPALEGRRQVNLADGTRVDVEPLYELLRRKLSASYTPEMAEKTTGVRADVIRRTARGMAGAKAALIYASTGACKHYHSDLMHRSFALLMALTGNQGKPGGGLRLGAWWSVTGFQELSSGEVSSWMKFALRVTGRPAVRDVEAYISQRARSEGFTPVLPWLQVHGGYAPTMGAAAANDISNPLGMDAAMKTAVGAGLDADLSGAGQVAQSLFGKRRQPAATMAVTADRPRTSVAEVRHGRQCQHADVDDGDAQRHRATGGGLLREDRHQVRAGPFFPTSFSTTRRSSRAASRATSGGFSAAFAGAFRNAHGREGSQRRKMRSARSSI